jgi:capsular polysaccharide biosynthesis protein
VFRKRTTTELLHDPAAARHITARPLGRPETVPLPPLPAGRHMFPHVRPGEVLPPGHGWDASSYVSVTPWLLTFHDVLIHSDAGIILAGDAVVSDTLQQTAPEPNAYRDHGAAIALSDRPEIIDLPGTWLSLLGGNYANYYHWTLEGLARLAPVPPELLAAHENILIPAGLDNVRRDGLARTRLEAGRRIFEVPPAATYRLQHLTVPWTVTGFHLPHPCIAGFFKGLKGDPAPDDLPRRIYIDRRASDRRPNAHRRLRNEDEVVAALSRLGFKPVRLEGLSLQQQIALFAHAEAIVAPHGAGLANLVFARPGTILIELHMDTWTNWCFRHLAAVCGLRYDAVVGRAEPAPGTRVWSVPILHLVAAVDAAMK